MTILELALSRVDVVKAEFRGELRRPGQFKEEIVGVLEALGGTEGVQIAEHGREHAEQAMGLVMRDGVITIDALQALWLDGVACGLAIAQVQRDEAAR